MKRVFGEYDWIEIRRESHHPYAMCTVAGCGKAWQLYKAMGLMEYNLAVDFIQSYPA